jgi:hypothetical protein
MASAFVAHRLAKEDEAIHFTRDEDLGYWQRQAGLEFEATFGLAENDGELQYE